MDYFKKVINSCKQMNYCEFHSDKFENYVAEVKAIIEEKKK